MGDRSEEVGERGQMFPVLRRIVDLCNEKTGIFGPISQLRSRFIHNPDYGEFPQQRPRTRGAAAVAENSWATSINHLPCRVVYLARSYSMNSLHGDWVL